MLEALLAGVGTTTVAGLVLNQLRRIPALGDHVTAAGWRFEVVDMDRRRVDKLLVTRTPAGANTEPS